MKTAIGDIWEHWKNDPTSWVVVPTNVGWMQSGSNPMGRGIAQQAASKFPDLPRRYGFWCYKCGDALFIWRKKRILCAPSKKLNMVSPYLSWQEEADPKTIYHSYEQIAAFAQKDGSRVWLPLFGAGNGGLSSTIADVILQSVEMPENVTLVRRA